MFAGVGARQSGAVISSARQLSWRSSRQFSSFAVNRTPPLRLRRSGHGVIPPTGENSLQSVASPIGAVRFSSTAPQQSSEAASEVNDALSNSNLVDLHDVPEQMGYLKTLGLDFGYGPSSLIQSTVEAIHIFGAMPWWGSAIILAILTRGIMVKFVLDSSENAMKLKYMKPQLDPLKDRMLAYQKAGDHEGSQLAIRERRDLLKQNGIKVSKSFLPLLQVPLGFGSYRVLNGMSTLPVPTLSSESVAWFSDLTVGDPLFILPLLATATMALTMRRGMRSGLNNVPENPGFKGAMLYGLPVMSMLFMSGCPALVQIYFASAGAISLIQTYLMSWSSFRSAINLSPLRPPELPEPPRSDPNASFIDRKMDEIRSNYKRTQEWMAGKSKEIWGEATNKKSGSDNSESQPLSGFEKRRTEQIAAEREIRNQRRREAHMKKVGRSQNQKQ